MNAGEYWIQRKELTPFALSVFAAVLWLPAFHGRAGGTFAVQSLPGEGSDISVGADGTAWLVGYDPFNRDRNLYRWGGQGWEKVDGHGTRIAVDPQGNPWVLDGDGDVRHWENGSWSLKPGQGTDIAVGANGDVWMVGWYLNLLDTDNNPENRPVYQWTGSDWQEIKGGAVRIAVAPDGTPWIINDSAQIRQRVAGEWVDVAGKALDIGIGADNSIWISIFGDDWDHNGDLARREGTNWISQSHPSTAVTVDPTGMPWFAKGDGALFRGIASELRLSMPILRDGKIEFSFPTVSNASYVVQSSGDLSLPWAELQRITGNGSTVTVTDTPPAGAGQTFYRVFQE